MTTLSRTDVSPRAHVAAAAIAAAILGFVALVLLSVLFALMVAVSMVERGRIGASPADLAVARNVLEHGWLIALGAAANVLAAIGILQHRAAGWLVAVSVAGAGAALGIAMFVAVQVGGAGSQGAGLAASAILAYALAVTSLLTAPHSRST